MNKYSLVKDLFIDNLDSCNFIDLDKSKIAYHKIISSLEKPLKLVLFYGKPGSGKSFLLKKIEKDLKDKGKLVVLLEQPFYSESTFFTVLADKLLDKNIEVKSYNDFLSIFEANTELSLRKEGVIVLLDEAQLYPDLLIEKIRLLSDTRMFKFLFTVHKTIAKEDLLAQEHFLTRIWEKIELEESTESEVRLYIDKKLENKLDKNFFSSKEIKLIFELTKGNLRTLNMFLYKVFEIFEFYEKEKFTELNKVNIKKKIIEMAALDKGLLNA